MGPYIRILLRYGVGGIIGYEVGDHLAADPDVIAVTTAATAALVGFATEGFYLLARKLGWRT
ncbi:hypothetical protein C7441_11974 [Pseudaminobacter salicylatoxidans]|uniref:Uncharacterized protein n=1 Tax=Pseudaminobacter salicylatoxidans TaxID=93369 RepID=A0A316BWB5_PSESE|nr:hypothetical protein [Pseudaminobacter salicylatoxidans]PWJ76386.1 hypothetical protein C7441_11974 [Pseudaminobacter salicylatoxidans]